jgi:DNA repair protein RecO (recombination protein O)
MTMFLLYAPIMDWTDQGILISARPLGEANAVAEFLTEAHGRHLGLVRGGRSRRLRPLLQPGNLVSLVWRARLSDYLGSFTVELIEPHAARVLDDEPALQAIGSLTALAKLLPERDPHHDLYGGALEVLRALDRPRDWPQLMVLWELALLEDLGFGLDCSAGAQVELVYVSPKTGRAVSREAGAPFADRLLKLPRFVLGVDPAPAASEILAGFALTGYFLDRNVMSPHGLSLPRSRERMLTLLARKQGAAA